MFEKISRLKLRYESSVGNLTTEDLWDLPLTSTKGRANLDDVARTIHKQLKDGENISFVNEISTANTTLQLKLDVVKHIIAVKVAENAAERAASDNRDKKQRILQVMAEKQSAALSSASMEELQAMLNSL